MIDIVYSIQCLGRKLVIMTIEIVTPDTPYDAMMN